MTSCFNPEAIYFGDLIIWGLSLLIAFCVGNFFGFKNKVLEIYGEELKKQEKGEKENEKD